MYIKASSINNLSDARYFAAQYSVEFMGFCLEEGSQAYIPPHIIKAMKEWIEGPKLIGEFGIETTAHIIAQIDDIGLDAVQLSMFSDADTTALRGRVTVIQEIIVEKDATFASLKNTIQHFSAKADILLLDFEKSAWSFQDIVRHPEISLDVLQRICQEQPIIIAINANPKQYTTLSQAIIPQGIAIRGGEEERVGYKSFEELNDIFDSL